MTTHIKILSPSDIKTFDLPPVFNIEERKRFLICQNGQMMKLDAAEHQLQKLVLFCSWDTFLLSTDLCCEQIPC